MPSGTTMHQLTGKLKFSSDCAAKYTEKNRINYKCFHHKNVYLFLVPTKAAVFGTFAKKNPDANVLWWHNTCFDFWFWFISFFLLLEFIHSNNTNKINNAINLMFCIFFSLSLDFFAAESFPNKITTTTTNHCSNWRIRMDKANIIFFLPFQIVDIK